MQIYLCLFSAIMFIVGLYAIITTLLNIRFFSQLGKGENKTQGPLISIIVPARDEEKNLPILLDSLTKQSYENIEILIINDQSSDRTEEIIKEYEKKDPRVKGFSTDSSVKLNNNGKINALLQLIPHVKGEYILATDADTKHERDCVAHAYSIMERNNLDVISGFPTEICPTFMGTVNISAMMFTSILIPHFLVYRFPIPSAAFAIGQFIMMRTDAYNETGGYSCIKGHICDDVGIVRLFVRKKKKFAFISICNYVSCHMYGSSKEAFRGIERSISGVFPHKKTTIIPLLMLVVLLLHLSLAPVAALIFYFLAGPDPAVINLLFGWLLFFIAWYIGCRKTNWRKRISLSCSLTLIQISLMYLHGLYMQIKGESFVWKGREINA